MKSFKQFLTESINISGDFNGNLYMNSSTQEPEEVGEQFCADILYQGSLHRLNLKTKTGIPTREQLGEHIQSEYPGAIVQTIYTVDESDSPYRVQDAKRYNPSKLEWL